MAVIKVVLVLVVVALAWQVWPVVLTVAVLGIAIACALEGTRWGRNYQRRHDRVRFALHGQRGPKWDLYHEKPSGRENREALREAVRRIDERRGRTEQ